MFLWAVITSHDFFVCLLRNENQVFPSNNFTFENNTLGLEAITTRYIFENCPSLSLSNQPDDLLADNAGELGCQEQCVARLHYPSPVLEIVKC